MRESDKAITTNLNLATMYSRPNKPPSRKIAVSNALLILGNVGLAIYVITEFCESPQNWIGISILAAVVLLDASGLIYGILGHREETLAAFTESEAVKLEIADLKTRAAEANEKAERERLERIKLEEKFTPRSISPEQGLVIQKALLRFAGHKIDLFTSLETTEIIRFESQVIRVLAMSGWSVKCWSVGPYGASFSGLGVEMMMGEDSTVANALVAAFKSQGVDIGITGAFTGPELPGPANGPPRTAENIAKIRMWVGAKE